MKKDRIIYCVTNLVNYKKYIGFDSYNRVNYLGSGMNIRRSIKKYGKENFVKQTLQNCISDEDMFEAEKYWIVYFNAKESDLFYNMTEGGEGGDTFTHNPNKEITRKRNSERSKLNHALSKIKNWQTILNENKDINDKKNNQIKNRWKDEVFKKEQVQKMKDGKTPLSYLKMSISIKKTLSTNEQKEKKKNIAKELWKNSEYREKQLINLENRRKKSNETRKIKSIERQSKRDEKLNYLNNKFGKKFIIYVYDNDDNLIIQFKNINFCAKAFKSKTRTLLDYIDEKCLYKNQFFLKSDEAK